MAGVFLLVTLTGAWFSPVLADDVRSNPYEGVRISRLSLIEGEVLLQRGDDEEWIPASVNIPLRPHDKLWVTEGSRSEIQFDDGSMVRLAENTNVDLLDLEPGRTQLQITLGVASFVIHPVPGVSESQGMISFETDTPQAAVLVNHFAKFRIDVAEDGSTAINVREGKIDLSTDEEPVVVAKNQRVVIDSNESPSYRLESFKESDEWDQWNENRDNQIAGANSRAYLPPGISMGVTELDTYGNWTRVPAYGWVWTPQAPMGWAPYQNGRWVWIEPWGWTWVSYEPWGWVPYHHGRWIVISGRWVWVPGPPMEAWAPGYVRFIYGEEWIGWVPLAPREVYYYNPGPFVHVDINLVNYRIPGAVTLLSRQTFISGRPGSGRFILPRDPVRMGRVIAGSPPVLPIRASLWARSGEVARPRLQPPQVIHRPVVYDHRASNPPEPFERRIKELREVVQQGRPPIASGRRFEEKRIPGFNDSGRQEKIHKDIMVRKMIREPVMSSPPSPPTLPPGREEPRRPNLPLRSEVLARGGQPHPPRSFELRQEARGHPGQVRPLYRKPPRPARPVEVK
ncbi:MAG: DUF6600 domain-containing protein [Nitrospiria bacterium]